MKLLAMESSTMMGGVSFLEDGQVLLTLENMRQNSHSEVMNEFVDQGLKKLNWKLSGIDLFSVGQGPGSFTGVRVAANIGKTFSFSHHKPLHSRDTLAVLAWPARHLGQPVFSMINAYKNMVYFAAYEFTDGKMTEVHKPGVVHVQDLAQVIQRKYLAVGDGYLAFEKYFSDEVRSQLLRNEKISDHALSHSLAELAWDDFQNNPSSCQKDWKSFVPLYLRASEAEENQQGIVYRPL